LALPLDEPLSIVPTDFVRILDRDLAAATIPKQDERGRTVDLHAIMDQELTTPEKESTLSEVGPDVAARALHAEDEWKNDLARGALGSHRP
jgi:hypothetical protein